MKNDDITSDQWDTALLNYLAAYTAADMLSIPGVYEIVSEHFNNEVLEILEAEDEDSEEN